MMGIFSSLLRSRDRASLAAGLPHDSYDPEGQVFLGRDGSLGLAWDLELLDTETRSAADLDQLSQRFAELLKHIPSGAALGLLLRSDRKVEAELRPWTSLGGLDGMEGLPSSPGARAAAELVGSHARLLAGLSFDDEGRPFQARRLKLCLSLHVFPGLSPSPRGALEVYEREKTRLLECAVTLEGFFTQLRLPCRRMDAEALKSLLYQLLNPRRSLEIPPRPFRPEEPLRHQVVRSAARFEAERGLLTLDETPMKILSMVELPQETLPGLLSRSQEGTPSLLEALPDALLFYGIEVLDDAEARRALEKKYAFAWNQLRTRRKLSIAAIEEDANGALGELLGGRRLLRLRLQVAIPGTSPEDASLKSATAKRLLQDLGFDVVEEDALALSLYLQSLPLAYDPTFDRGFKRSRSILSSNLAELLPVYGAYRGTPTPEILLQNRRGEPVSFSFFDSEVAPHGIVTGTSGSGKSFFTNYFVASVRRGGSPVFILDRGHSYRKLARVLGGQYISFDPDRPVRINPIGRAESFDKERLLFVKDILSEMCAQGEEPVRKEERSVLETAILKAVERKGQGEVFISEVYQALLEEARSGPASLRQELDRLTLSLRPFVGRGAYAGFFDGPSEVDWGRGLTVFELGEIALRKEIAPALLMAILYSVADFCGKPENLALRKYLILDEAWTLLESPATSRFIVNALKTYRKIGTAAVMVTQQAADFDGRAGAAILANAPNRVFLRQTPETLLAMEKHMALTPEAKKAIGSLRTAKGKYSELFLTRGDEAGGVARLIPDPTFYLLATSDAAENAKLEAEAERRRAAGDPAAFLSALRALAEASSGAGRAP